MSVLAGMVVFISVMYVGVLIETLETAKLRTLVEKYINSKRRKQIMIGNSSLYPSNRLHHVS